MDILGNALLIADILEGADGEGLNDTAAMPNIDDMAAKINLQSDVRPK